MTDDSTVEQQLQTLRREIDEHNFRYYIEDAPSVPDAEYDRLFQRLLQLEQQHPQLVSPDSPSQRVGATALTGFSQVVHQVPMLSLANAFSDQDLTDFDRRIHERPSRDSVSGAVRTYGEPDSRRGRDGLQRAWTSRSVDDALRVLHTREAPLA